MIFYDIIMPPAVDVVSKLAEIPTLPEEEQVIATLGLMRAMMTRPRLEFRPTEAALAVARGIEAFVRWAGDHRTAP